jgi:hypothetical protein
MYFSLIRAIKKKLSDFFRVILDPAFDRFSASGKLIRSDWQRSFLAGAPFLYLE